MHSETKLLHRQEVRARHAQIVQAVAKVGVHIFDHTRHSGEKRLEPRADKVQFVSAFDNVVERFYAIRRVRIFHVIYADIYQVVENFSFVFVLGIYFNRYHFAHIVGVVRHHVFSLTFASVNARQYLVVVRHEARSAL